MNWIFLVLDEDGVAIELSGPSLGGPLCEYEWWGYVTIPAYQHSTQVRLVTIPDGIKEGEEHIIVDNYSICNDAGQPYLTFLIKDVPPPVAKYLAEDNATDGAGDNDGSLNGSLEFALGAQGNAFKFDGVDDYVSVGDDASLDMASEVTITMWVKPAASGGVLLHKGNSSVCNYGVKMTSGNVIQAYFNDSSVNGSALEVSSSGVALYSDYEHVAISFKQVGSQVEIKTYVAGELVRSDALTGDLGNTVNASALFLGAGPGGISEFFNGRVDELTIYDRVLDAHVIQKQYLSRRFPIITHVSGGQRNGQTYDITFPSVYIWYGDALQASDFQFERTTDMETWGGGGGTVVWDAVNNEITLVDEMAGIDPYYGTSTTNWEQLYWRVRIVKGDFTSDWWVCQD